LFSLNKQRDTGRFTYIIAGVYFYVGFNNVTSPLDE
jgi:hypothetical protein